MGASLPIAIGLQFMFYKQNNQRYISMPAPKRKGNAKIDQRGRANFKYPYLCWQTTLGEDN